MHLFIFNSVISICLSPCGKLYDWTQLAVLFFINIYISSSLREQTFFNIICLDHWNIHRCGYTQSFHYMLAVNSALDTVTARWVCCSKKNKSFEEPIWKARLAESILSHQIPSQIKIIPEPGINNWWFKLLVLGWLVVYHFLWLKT